MHNHNNNKNHSMWWMMLLCALPLIILLFAGGNLSLRGYLWPVLIGGFAAVHFWMIFRGHCSRSDNHCSESNGDQGIDSDHEEHKKNNGHCR